VGSENKRISGLVIPTKWDKNGNVLGAALFDRKERQFVIQQDEMGKQLLKLLNEDVEIQATITIEKKGKTILKVKNFWLNTGDDKREDELICSERG
jgi:hypothetical protein